jgi:hypothetical protein
MLEKQKCSGSELYGYLTAKCFIAPASLPFILTAPVDVIRRFADRMFIRVIHGHVLIF